MRIQLSRLGSDLLATGNRKEIGKRDDKEEVHDRSEDSETKRQDEYIDKKKEKYFELAKLIEK